MGMRACAMRFVPMVFVLALSGPMSSSAVRGDSARDDEGLLAAGQEPANGKGSPKEERSPLSNSKEASSYGLSAFLFMKIGDIDQALIDIDKAIALDRQNSLFHTFRGNLNIRKREYELAIRDCDTAISIDPKNHDAYSQRGQCHENMKNLEKAIQDFDSAIGINPNNAIYYVRRGSCYLNKGDVDQAKKDMDKTIELDPKNSLAYQCRAICHASKQDWASALGDYSTYVDLNPGQELSRRASIENNIKKVRETSQITVRFLSFTPDKDLQREIVARSEPEIVPNGVERNWSKEHTISRAVRMTSQNPDAAWRGLVRAWWVEVERGCQFVESRLNEDHASDPGSIRREAKFVGDGATAVTRAEVILYRTGTVKLKVGEKTYSVPVRYESDFDYQVEKVADK